MKGLMSNGALLAFPDFKRKFTLHTDASDVQIGGVLSQEGKPLGFFSKKSNTAQRKYTVTQRELLAIVESLKHFRNIIYGHEIEVFTDHQNPTYENTNYASDRILRQRLTLEEYGAKLIYVSGEKNVVADSLSRLPTAADSLNIGTEEVFALERTSGEDSTEFVLDNCVIVRKQATDEFLQDLITKDSKLIQEIPVGGLRIWTVRIDEKSKEYKIYIPKLLRVDVLQWYHTNLRHPGIERMYATIRQNFLWPGLKKEVTKLVQTCETCQKNKVTGAKAYRTIPTTDDRQVPPWDTVHVDLVGPWKVHFKLTRSGRTLTQQVKGFTAVDKATGWPEILAISDKQGETVATLFDDAWLCRYPRPRRVEYDNGSEFVGFEFQELLSSYGIEPVPTTVKNPQANSPVERMHLTMADMLHTSAPFTGHDWFRDVQRMLQAIAWAIRSTINTAVQYTPGQLAFHRDMITATHVRVDWDRVYRVCAANSAKSNAREIVARVPHRYAVGEKVLVKLNDSGHKWKLNAPFEGPFVILKVCDNGTLQIQRGAYEEIIHLRRVKPFLDSDNEQGTEHHLDGEVRGGECHSPSGTD